MATCGTGLDIFGPKPGDPVLSVATIQAWAILGGVAVQWTYPTENAHAIAHSLLFRSTVNDINSLTQIAIVAGSQYNDMLNIQPDIGLYYWVRFVTVNGTVGPLIGPAYVVPRSTIGDIITDLEGQITGSKLHQDLQSKIDRITDLTSGLSDAEQARLLGDNYLSQLWDQLNRDLQAVDTLIANEVMERVTADSALAATLNLVFAQTNDNKAAIATETIARTNAVSAVAAQITTLEAAIADNYVSIQQFMSVSNTVNGIREAEYFVKIDDNGFVSGFGLYSSGGSSLFLINATKFAIGHPNTPNNIPFIVSGGKVYIKNALIQDLAVDTLKIAGNAVTATVHTAGTGTTVEEETDGLYPGAKVVFIITHHVVGHDYYDIWFRFYMRERGTINEVEIPGSARYSNSEHGYISGTKTFLQTVPGNQGESGPRYHLKAKVFFHINDSAAGGSGPTIIGNSTITAIGAKR